MTRFEIYTRTVCPYCTLAKRLLESKEQKWVEINLDENPDKTKEMLERSGGRSTVPEIFLDGELIGGWDDLSALQNSGELDRRLGEAG